MQRASGVRARAGCCIAYRLIVRNVGEDVEQRLAWWPAGSTWSRRLELVKEEEVGPVVVEARHAWSWQLGERGAVRIDKLAVCVDRVRLNQLREVVGQCRRE